MIRVALETGDHEPVVSGLIPPFDAMPDVIHWGDRTFELRLPPTAEDEGATYTEVFAVALVHTI